MLRGPGRKCNATAWLEYPAHLRNGDFGTGRKHMAKLANDNIKPAIGDRQVLSVPLKPLNVQVCYTRVLACYIEQGRREIDPSYRCANPRCRDRNDACASANIEYALAGLDLCELDQVRSDRRGERGGWRKGRPHFALARL